MPYMRALFTGVLLIGLGACTQTWIQDQLAPIRAMSPSGSAFTQALHGEYLWLADAEYSGNDLSDALYYGDKARRAGGGEEVAPEDPTAQGMPAHLQAEAERAYARLTDALNGGGKTAAPEQMARAQVAYDCMVREWCEPHAGIADCQNRFANAMAAVEAALRPTAMMAPPERDFLVFFDWDRANIRADAARILDQVVSAIGALGSTKVNLVGNTDTTGPADYNMGLSVRRADAVRAYLMRRGVSSSSVMAVGRGESDLRVPTPDNVREEENRRVEISIE